MSLKVTQHQQTRAQAVAGQIPMFSLLPSQASGSIQYMQQHHSDSLMGTPQSKRLK